jgi:hypothetical protein
LHDCLRGNCINSEKTTRDARVIHEASDLPEFALGRLEQSKDFFFTADIGLDRDGSATP